jgi:colicin import membrane protein
MEEDAQVLEQQKGEAQEFQARAAAEAVGAKQRQLAQFTERIRQKIKSRVVLPPGLNGNPEAIYSVTLLPGGEVQDVRLVKSSGVPAYDAAVEHAIHAADPFPVPSDPDLFQILRQANYKF